MATAPADENKPARTPGKLAATNTTAKPSTGKAAGGKSAAAKSTADKSAEAKSAAAKPAAAKSATVKSATAKAAAASAPAAKTPSARSATARSVAAKSVATNSGAAKTLKATAARNADAPKATATRVAKGAVKKPGKSSRDSATTTKEHDEHVDRVWELAKRIGIAMFVTWDGEEQRARPLAATVEKEEGAVYFLTDVKGAKDDQVEEFPHVSVSFADHKHAKYVALSGKASVLNDREKIKDLWSPFAKAWWDSPEDPSIRVIKLVPRDAELWDSPGRIVTTISMLAAAVTGRTPKIGENAKVIL